MENLVTVIFAFCTSLTPNKEARIECFTRMSNCIVPYGREADSNDIKHCKEIVKKADLSKSEEDDK